MPRLFKPPELNPDDYKSAEDMLLDELGTYGRHVRSDRIRQFAGIDDDAEREACEDCKAGACAKHDEDALKKIASLSLEEHEGEHGGG